jgi:hypothetical protein
LRRASISCRRRSACPTGSSAARGGSPRRA